jgi:hypothetical protein
MIMTVFPRLCVLLLALAAAGVVNADEAILPKSMTLQPLTDDTQSDQILILMEPVMSATVDRMSSEILKGLKANEDILPESIEIPSQPEIHEYIWITFAEPTLDSFRPELSQELESGYEQVHQEVPTWKKDKKTFKTKSRKHAMKMLNRIKHRFEKHYTKAYKEWVKFQALQDQLEEEDGTISEYGFFCCHLKCNIHPAS